MQSFAEGGLLTIGGGCCGTTPAHIKYATPTITNTIILNSAGSYRIYSKWEVFLY